MTGLATKQRLASRQKLGRPITLSEVFATNAADAAVTGFALASVPKARAPLLWVQDRLSAKEAGRPYLPGLYPARAIIRVDVTRAADVLWAIEDGLRCKALCAVIGEIWGDPPALSFTASKRLAMRAETGGVPCWLIRRAAMPNLSAARDRWRVSSLPSTLHPHDAQAPGDPRWRVALFRSRQSQPGEWVARYDRTSDRLDFSATFRDGTLAEMEGTARQRDTG